MTEITVAMATELIAKGGIAFQDQNGGVYIIVQGILLTVKEAIQQNDSKEEVDVIQDPAANPNSSNAG